MASLTLDNVDKVYGTSGRISSRRQVTAVRQLSMRVNDGEIVGLLGSSGCGKTSTLRMIAGLESISGGEMRIGERIINQLWPSQRNVAMAFEGYALYPPLRVRDNIAFSLLRDKMPKAEIERKVKTIADLLDIGGILERYPPNLSGGQQQRVSLARALVRGADVHLLDEPMSQLEPQLRAILRARIKDYLIQNGMTTVFVTHDQTEAVALADRIAVMEAGELQQFASPDELSERPGNLFVASFIGEPPMNVFPGRVEARNGALNIAVSAEPRAEQPAFALTLPSQWVSADARTVLSDGREIYIGIRPHQVLIGGVEAAGDRDSTALMSVTGTVVSSQWLGDQTHIGFQVGDCFLIAVSGSDVQAPLDSAVAAVLPVDALHVFDRGSKRALLHGMEVA